MAATTEVKDVEKEPQIVYLSGADSGDFFHRGSIPDEKNIIFGALYRRWQEHHNIHNTHIFALSWAIARRIVYEEIRDKKRDLKEKEDKKSKNENIEHEAALARTLDNHCRPVSEDDYTKLANKEHDTDHDDFFEPCSKATGEYLNKRYGVKAIDDTWKSTLKKKFIEYWKGMRSVFFLEVGNSDVYLREYARKIWHEPNGSLWKVGELSPMSAVLIESLVAVMQLYFNSQHFEGAKHSFAKAVRASLPHAEFGIEEEREKLPWEIHAELILFVQSAPEFFRFFMRDNKTVGNPPQTQAATEYRPMTQSICESHFNLAVKAFDEYTKRPANKKSTFVDFLVQKAKTHGDLPQEHETRQLAYSRVDGSSEKHISELELATPDKRSTRYWLPEKDTPNTRFSLHVKYDDYGDVFHLHAIKASRTPFQQFEDHHKPEVRQLFALSWAVVREIINQTRMEMGICTRKDTLDWYDKLMRLRYETYHLKDKNDMDDAALARSVDNHCKDECKKNPHLKLIANLHHDHHALMDDQINAIVTYFEEQFDIKITPENLRSTIKGKFYKYWYGIRGVYCLEKEFDEYLKHDIKSIAERRSLRGWDLSTSGWYASLLFQISPDLMTNPMDATKLCSDLQDVKRTYQSFDEMIDKMLNGHCVWKESLNKDQNPSEYYEVKNGFVEFACEYYKYIKCNRNPIDSNHMLSTKVTRNFDAIFPSAFHSAFEVFIEYTKKYESDAKNVLLFLEDRDTQCSSSQRLRQRVTNFAGKQFINLLGQNQEHY